MERWKNIITVGLLAACLLVGGWAAQTSAENSAKPIVWRLQSTWPTGNLLHKSIQRLAEDVEQMSGGRLRWEVMPAGAIVGAFEVLDAVHRGLIDAAHAWPGYWAGKHPAAGLYGPPPAARRPRARKNSSPGCSPARARACTTSCCRRNSGWTSWRCSPPGCRMGGVRVGAQAVRQSGTICGS